MDVLIRITAFHVLDSSSDQEHIHHQQFGSSLSSLEFQKINHLHHHHHRHSPSLDQGYATLLSSPTQSAISNHTKMNISSTKLLNQAMSNMNTVGLAQKVATLSINNNSLCSFKKYNSPSTKLPMFFDALSNDAIIKIFQWLDTFDLLVLATVCRRFEKLIWNPQLWKTISLKGDGLNGDKALNCILRKLSDQSVEKSSSIDRVMLSEGCKMTEKGVQSIVRRCSNITHLQAQFCTSLTNHSLYEIVTKCTNLQHLDLTGCSSFTCISLNAGIDTPRKLLLQYLDLTDCAALDDIGLKTIIKNCPLLVYLYLRRCAMLTDMSLKILPKFCIALKELSVSDCLNVTDFGLYELAKLGQTLRYLSVAKCQVSDVGIKYLAKRYCRNCFFFVIILRFQVFLF